MLCDSYCENWQDDKAYVLKFGNIKGMQYPTPCAHILISIELKKHVMTSMNVALIRFNDWWAKSMVVVWCGHHACPCIKFDRKVVLLHQLCNYHALEIGRIWTTMHDGFSICRLRGIKHNLHSFMRIRLNATYCSCFFCS